MNKKPRYVKVSDETFAALDAYARTDAQRGKKQPYWEQGLAATGPFVVEATPRTSTDVREFFPLVASNLSFMYERLGFGDRTKYHEFSINGNAYEENGKVIVNADGWGRIAFRPLTEKDWRIVGEGLETGATVDEMVAAYFADGYEADLSDLEDEAK